MNNAALEIFEWLLICALLALIPFAYERGFDDGRRGAELCGEELR